MKNFFILLNLIFLGVVCYAEEIYKYKDKQGIPTYSDSIPQGVDKFDTISNESSKYSVRKESQSINSSNLNNINESPPKSIDMYGTMENGKINIYLKKMSSYLVLSDSSGKYTAVNGILKVRLTKIIDTTSGKYEQLLYENMERVGSSEFKILTIGRGAFERVVIGYILKPIEVNTYGADIINLYMEYDPYNGLAVKNLTTLR